MRKEDEARLKSWIGRELLPPVIRWVAVEHLPLNARFLQGRARRAWALGEVNEHVVHALMFMSDPVLRWCWAEGVGAKTSAWIDPQGQVIPVEYGKHWEWVTQNMQNLVAQGVAPPEPEKQKAGAVATLMMQQGWIRYSGGVIMTMPMPNETQIAAIDGLIRQSAPPQGFTIQFFIEGPGVRGEVPAQDVIAKGAAQTLAELGQGAPQQGEVPLTKHRQADMGGASDGPEQQGDGQDVQNSFMEQVEDGSTAPIDRAYQYMKQDWQPEVWWAQNLQQYLEKSYPGKPAPGAQSDADSIPSATGPGQQFASVVKSILRVAGKAFRFADATDPSDTDGQHDQLSDSMENHLVDPDSVLYRGNKGRGNPFTTPTNGPAGDSSGEARTRLGLLGRWRDRRSDKAVEQQIIQMEKGHLEPGQIRQELRQDGVPSQVIDETYQNRDKNLVKEITL